MKKPMVSMIAVFFMVMGIAFAAQTDSATKEPAAASHEGHAGHDASKSAQQTPNDTQPAASPDMNKLAEMMKNTQDLMEKIKNTADHSERTKLMLVHMKMMREGMKMMRGVSGGCPMMKDMMGGGMAKQKTPQADGQGMMGMEDMKCHQMMGKKMEMMQSMMEQLVESQYRLLQDH